MIIKKQSRKLNKTTPTQNTIYKKTINSKINISTLKTVIFIFNLIICIYLLFKISELKRLESDLNNSISSEFSYYLIKAFISLMITSTVLTIIFTIICSCIESNSNHLLHLHEKLLNKGDEVTDSEKQIIITNQKIITAQKAQQKDTTEN